MAETRAVATARGSALCVMSILIAIEFAPVSGVPVVVRRQLPPLPSAEPAGEGLGAARTIQPAGPVDPAALAYAAQHSTKPPPDTDIGSASTSELRVVIPAGVEPGSKLLVEAPDGQHLQVTVPPATVPGQVILVHVPPASLTVPFTDSIPSPSPHPAVVSQVFAPPSTRDEVPATATAGASGSPARQPVTILNRDLSHLT